MDFSEKLRSKMQYGLTMNSVRLLLMKIGIDISPYYWFREGALLTEEPRIKGSKEEYTVGLLGPQDMEYLEKLDLGWSRSRDRIQGLLDGTEKCIAIKHNGEIAAFMWMNLKEFRYKSTLQELTADEVYLTDMFTVKSYRGLNLAPYLRYKSYLLLRELNRNFFYSISICFNTPAIRFKEKLNARKMKLVFLMRFFNRYQMSFVIKKYPV
jgi:hypothetical protein